MGQTTEAPQQIAAAMTKTMIGKITVTVKATNAQDGKSVSYELNAMLIPEDNGNRGHLTLEVNAPDAVKRSGEFVEALGAVLGRRTGKPAGDSLLKELHAAIGHILGAGEPGIEELRARLREAADRVINRETKTSQAESTPRSRAAELYDRAAGLLEYFGTVAGEKSDSAKARARTWLEQNGERLNLGGFDKLDEEMDKLFERLDEAGNSIAKIFDDIFSDNTESGDDQGGESQPAPDDKSGDAKAGPTT